MYTDTHCHVLASEYDSIEVIINNLAKDNLKRIIINGYDYVTNLEVLELTNKYSQVYGALGFHPTAVQADFNMVFSQIKANINNPKIVAIGEIGLDYYYTKDTMDKQKECFNLLLELAEKHDKPVIIHNREATGDLVKILKAHKNRGILHCFSGSAETAKEYIKMGFKLGINGIVTFKNSNLPAVLLSLTPNNILLETDAPYLTPEPFRKNKNEPKYIVETAKKVAEIYNLSAVELAAILEQNLHDIFDI